MKKPDRWERLVVIALALSLPVWGWAGQNERIPVPYGNAPDWSMKMPKSWDGENIVFRYTWRLNQSNEMIEYVEVSVKHHECYQRMREASSNMKNAMHPNPNSRSLSRGFVMTEKAWDKDFEPIYKDCVEGAR